LPRILKTVLPRIRRSIAERGVLVSIRRSVLLPFHLISEYRDARRLPQAAEHSDFDRAHGVDTDGAQGDWTYLSDLKIPSRNWIHGNDYCGIEPERFNTVLSAIPLKYEDFTFIDFGSGKGRALLLASHFPFRRIVGVEFSPDLHAAAQRNILSYPRHLMRCAEVESLCRDFLEFELPPEPSVLFFFDPCSEVLFHQWLRKLRASVQAHPRPLFVIYIAPGRKKPILDHAEFLAKIDSLHELDAVLYQSRTN
jgi:SAM-dependent methyltransferase